MAEPTIIDGVPEEFLDAAVNVGWGMGFSHLRRVIATVMPLHERMVREQVAAELREIADGHRRTAAPMSSDRREGWLSLARCLDDAAAQITRTNHAAAIARGDV